MLKNKFKFMFLLIAVVVLISTLSFATDTEEISIDELLSSAAEGSEEDAEEYVDDDWINNDLYEMGDTVTIDKVVDGNVFVMAQEVTITSEIGGDAFVMANKVTIDGGYIYSSLFVMANEVVIDGVVYDVYGLANNFTLAEDGYVYRDLKVSANTINIDGKVRRDAYLSGVDFNLNEENGTLIGGNLTYSAASEINIPEGAILGEVKFEKEEVKVESVAEKAISYITNALNLLVYTCAVVLLAIWLAPKFVEKATNMSVKKAWASLGIGAASAIVVPIVLLLLLMSGIASRVSIAATFVFVAICMSGTAFASIYFGNLFAKLVKWEGKVKFVLASVIAALIIWIIQQIPFIGGIVGFLVALFGIGVLVVNIFEGKFKKNKEAKTVVEEVKE